MTDSINQVLMQIRTARPEENTILRKAKLVKLQQGDGDSAEECHE